MRKNKGKMAVSLRLIAIITLAALTGFSFAACGDADSGGGSANSALNGTWVSSYERMDLNNGSITIFDGNTAILRGSYSTSGSNITVTLKEVHGALFGSEAVLFGLSTNQWYTQQQLKTALGALFDPYAGQFFQPMTGTYTLSGNTLIMTMNGQTDTFTRR